MLRLSRMTDYGVVVMSQLAKKRDDFQSAQQIADETGLSLSTVSKLLKTLSKSDMIASLRGMSGGYALAEHPDEISVAKIIDTLEGGMSLTACVEGAENECMVQEKCPISGRWTPVNLAIRKALEVVSLSDMLQAGTPHGLANFMISDPTRHPS